MKLVHLLYDKPLFNKHPRCYCEFLFHFLYGNLFISGPEYITEEEAIELFFGLLQLFASNNASMHQMLLLVMKELLDAGYLKDHPDIMEMAISALGRDISCDSTLFRGIAY